MADRCERCDRTRSRVDFGRGGGRSADAAHAISDYLAMTDSQRQILDHLDAIAASLKASQAHCAEMSAILDRIEATLEARLAWQAAAELRIR